MPELSGINSLLLLISNLIIRKKCLLLPYCGLLDRGTMLSVLLRVRMNLMRPPCSSQMPGPEVQNVYLWSSAMLRIDPICERAPHLQS